MTSTNTPAFHQIVRPHEITAELKRELIDCWITVTNAGGAAGFPFPPVDTDHVAPVADRLIADLDPDRSRLLLAAIDGSLAGWLNIRRDINPVVAHWGTINHLQSHTSFRGRSVGTALMNRAR